MIFISLTLCILCLVIISKVISTLRYYNALWQQYKNIPGTAIVPFIDKTLKLIRMPPPDRARWYESYAYISEGIAVNWVGLNPIIHIFKPEFMEIIASSNVNIGKGVPYNMLRPWLGEGLLTSTGRQWFHDRKLIGPAFHFGILEDFATIQSEKAEILTKRLEEQIEKRQGEAIDFFPLALGVALDIICETAMGVDIHAQEIGNEYCKTVQRMTELIVERTCRPWLWSDRMYSLTSMEKEYKAGIHKLHEFTNAVINKKKAARRFQTGCDKPAEGEIDSDTGRRKRKAFLDLLLDQNEVDDAPLTDDELRAQVDTFMFAGHDTTAAAITWTLLCLSNNPEHQEKVHEELEQVFKDSQAPASTKELSQLKHLDRVIKETLRLFPSVPLITRILAEDVKFGDYNVSRGTTVVLSITLLHRNQHVWRDSLKFDPDRFLPENSKHRHPYAYMPFSAGVRNCIGQKFALLEEKTVLTAILRKWRVKSLDTLDTVKYSYTVIKRPWEKLLFHFTPKKCTART